MAVDSGQERAVEAADRSSAGAGQGRRREVHRRRIRIRKPQSGLLFRFPAGVAFRKAFSEDVIFHRCIGDLYAGSAISGALPRPAGRGDRSTYYLQRQLERTEEKYASSAVHARSCGCRSCRGWSTSSSARKPQRISAFGSRGRPDGRRHSQREQTEEDDDAIKKINETHALVLAGNKAVVMKFDEGTKFRLLQVSAFKAWFGNEIIGTGPAHPAWGLLADPQGQARIFRHRVLADRLTDARRLLQSLAGFRRQAAAGRSLEIPGAPEDNVARGDEEHFLWIVGWWAAIGRSLQRRWKLRWLFAAVWHRKIQSRKVFKSLVQKSFPER